MIPTPLGLIQAFSLFAVVLLLARPLGGYIRKVVEGERVFLSPVIRPVERLTYKLLRVDETVEQGWRAYAVSVIVFSFICILALYLQQRLQNVLPLVRAASRLDRSPPISPTTRPSASTPTRTGRTTWASRR
jgi:K+-transporting ATPase A subunit